VGPLFVSQFLTAALSTSVTPVMALCCQLL